MIRRIVLAVSAAVVAGTAATLSLAAAADAWLQPLYVIARPTRKARP